VIESGKQQGDFMTVQIEIKSRPGTFTTIPDEVAEAAKGYSWYLNRKGYVMAYVKGSKPRKFIYLHRLVIYVMTGKWPEKGMEVDHIDHDPLNNRMENLEVKTKSGNMRNRNKSEGASSQLQGVFWNKLRQKWFAMATVMIDGKKCHIHSSTTDDEILASVCADCIRHLVGGWHPSKLNYPERIFLDKWREIGEGQRRQIFRSMARQNVPIYDNTIFIERKVA
jgi:hypothetical protein